MNVAFQIGDFAFPAVSAEEDHYIRAINGPAVTFRQGTPCNPDAWRRVMKFFARLFRSKSTANLTTTLERQRLAQTMPGQTAAIVANRLGVLVH